MIDQEEYTIESVPIKFKNLWIRLYSQKNKIPMIEIWDTDRNTGNLMSLNAEMFSVTDAYNKFIEFIGEK